MSFLTISKRLQAIAALCPQGSRVADIGSDHALLASYLLTEKIASFVIAGELNEGPYQAALRQINTLQAKDRASVRKGNGLAVLAPGEVDVVCIAGMGGQLIASILQEGRDKLAQVKRLILQPNVGEDTVRQWLLENGWQLADEQIIEEDGIIYEILVAEQGDPLTPYKVHNPERTLAELLQIGPVLWAKKPPVLIKKWQREREKWEKILAQIEQSKRNETKEKENEIKQKLEWIEGVIRCLQTDKPSYNS